MNNDLLFINLKYLNCDIGFIVSFLVDVGGRASIRKIAL